MAHGTAPLVYPPLSRELRSGRVADFLRIFGPGAIIASVTIGSGETVFASRGGAIFGYALVWWFVLVLLLKGVQVYGAMRYMTLSGEHPMERWALLPGPRGWFPAAMGVMSIVCFPFWLSGLPLMLGSLTARVFGFDPAAWGKVFGTGFVALAITLTIVQTYAILEKAQTAIVAILLICILVATVATRPDWLAALAGLVPSWPAYEPWVAERYPTFASRPTWVEVSVYLGALGGGTQDYIGYVGMLREKAWGAVGLNRGAAALTRERLAIRDDADNVSRGRAWLRAPLIDVAISFVAIVIFSLAFLFLGAAILHPQRLVPVGLDLLTHQAQFLTRLHPALEVLYNIGIFAVFFGTIYGAYELYVRTSYECLRAVFPRLRSVAVGRIRPWVLLYCGLPGLALLWTIADPVRIVTFPAILGAVFTCGLWCFAMHWTDRKFLPKPLQMGKALTVLNLIAGAALTAFGVKAILDFLGG